MYFKISDKEYILINEGEIDNDIAKTINLPKNPCDGKLFSNDANIVACLQSGKILGYSCGNATIEYGEIGGESNRIINVFVMPGKKAKFPLYVNRWNGVSADFIPKNLVSVPKHITYNSDEEIFMTENTMKAYEKMMYAAEAEGVFLKVNYGYRSCKHQEVLIAESIRKNGLEATMKTAAPVGFSEHHTGMALDVVGRRNEEGVFVSSNRDAWNWLRNNCFKFGFMIKNLKGKEHITGTKYEPWHIRYIEDTKLAKYLHDNYLTLDEYLDSLNVGLCKGLSKNEYEYVRIAANAQKIPFKEALKRMDYIKENYKISYKKYISLKLYNYSEKTAEIQSELIGSRLNDEKLHMDNVANATGLSKTQIEQNLICLNENPYTKIDIIQYDEMKMYALKPNEIEIILKRIAKRNSLRKQLIGKFTEIDKGLENYGNIKFLVSEYYRVTKETLIQSEIDWAERSIKKCCAKSVLSNPEEICKITVDMLVCKRLFGFLDFEYFMFDLRSKSIKEKREYVSNYYRTKKLSMVNNRIECELFDNKGKTYNMFKKFYKRDVLIIYSDSEEEFVKFEAFCKKHSSFVKKPLNSAMGRGISLVNVSEETNIRKLFFSIFGELKEFLIEELIVCHEKLRKLNPDSVNTVRVTTYYDGNKTHILWPWMKIGRAGCFVDNAGAGGLGVAININTGEFFSDGFDENGQVFSSHPENNIRFKGYQCPNWEGAIELGYMLSEELVSKVTGIRFVGWDLTYTSNNEWIIIEGNTFPQLVQQASYGRGLKAELDEIIPD